MCIRDSDSTELRTYGTMTLGTAFPHGDTIWLFNSSGAAAVGDGSSRTTVNTVMNVGESTINFSIREIESILIANSVYGTANTPSMDIDNSSKVDINDSTSNTKIFDTDLNSLVFPIGFDNVKGLGSQSGTTFTAEGITFQRKEVLDTSFSYSGGLNATVTSPSGTTFEVEGKGTGETLEAPKGNYIVVATANSASLANSTGAITTGTNYIQKGEIVECSVEVIATNQVKLTAKRNANTYTAGTFLSLIHI